VARVLAAESHPGDVVAYCPDQLGPAVSRIAPAGLRQLVYPSGSPAVLNWVDYAARNAAGSPPAFASKVLATGQQHQIFLVYQPGYRTFGTSCQQIAGQLSLARPHSAVLVRASQRYFEHESLIRFSP
jgi:mannosyltransferase